MAPRLGPLAEREFRLLFTGQLISLLGSAVAPIALAFAVLDLTGSGTDLGLVLAAAWVPQLLLVLFGGVLADRLPRHLVMVGSNLLSAAAQGVIAVLLLTHHAQLWQFLAFQIVRGIATGVAVVARAPRFRARLRLDEVQPRRRRRAIPRTDLRVEPGEVTVTVHGQAVGRLGPGDAFGEMALIDKSARSATVTADTEVHAYQLPVWSFRPVVESHPEMVWALLEALAQRVRQAG